MKKLLLLSLCCVATLSAMCQSTEKSVVFNAHKQDVSLLSNKQKPVGPHSYMNNKKSRSVSRWINVVDAKDKTLGGAIYTNFASTVNLGVIWQDSTIKALYSNGTSLVQDYIWIKSIGQVIDPGYTDFNDVANYPGQIAFERGKAYTVDSVGIIGTYDRNPSKPTIVDTLIVSCANGSDFGSYYFTSSAVTANYSVDSVKFAGMDLNFSKLAIEGTSTIIKKIPLTAASVNDTIPGGWNYFQTPIGLTVPGSSLNLAGISVTFKSGDTWTPFVDSIGSGTNIIYNRFRFVSFEEADNTFRSYSKKDWNSSHLFPNDTTGWGTLYVPSFAYSGSSYGYEHHWIDWKITCATCNTGVGVNNIASNIEFIKASPNPATTNINFSFNLTESADEVTIQLSNLVGQVVKTVSLGSVSANNKVNTNLSVSDLPKGMYIYTVTADGQKSSNKIILE